MTEHIAQNTGCSEEDARKVALEQLEEDAINFVEDACRVHEYDPSDIGDEEDALEAVDANLAMQKPDEDPQDLSEKYFLAQAEAAKKHRKYQADVWAQFMKLNETSARSLYQVLELFLIISNGTAEVERFFKFIKAMKNKTRNRLGSEKARKMITIAWYLDLKKLDLDVLYKLLLQCMRRIPSSRF